MIRKIFPTMILALCLFFVTQTAKADPTYFTTGCFGAACAPGAVAVLPVGPGNLVFAGQIPFALGIPPGGTSAANLGIFTWTGTPFGATITPFTLQVTQTVPGPTGSQSFSALVTGTVSINSSQMQVIFSTTTVTINGYTYTLTNLGGPGTTSPNALLINPPGQTTTIQSIVAAPVPEPASMVLLGTGLLGAAGAIRRRRQVSK